MKAWLQTFVNSKQNNWAKLLLIERFAYNNAKSTSTGHTFFELNCRFYLCIFFKKDINSRSKSHLAKELARELKDLMLIC